MNSTKFQKKLYKSIRWEIRCNLDVCGLAKQFLITCKDFFKCCKHCIKKSKIQNLKKLIKRINRVPNYIQIRKRFVNYINTVDTQTLENLKIKYQYEGYYSKSQAESSNFLISYFVSIIALIFSVFSYLFTDKRDILFDKVSIIVIVILYIISVFHKIIVNIDDQNIQNQSFKLDCINEVLQSRQKGAILIVNRE